MLIQHPAMLSENMVSLYFFLLPQRCRISHRRQRASLLHWNLTIPTSRWPRRRTLVVLAGLPTVRFDFSVFYTTSLGQKNTPLVSQRGIKDYNVLI